MDEELVIGFTSAAGVGGSFHAVRHDAHNSERASRRVLIVKLKMRANSAR